jgi:hypothetical protein
VTPTLESGISDHVWIREATQNRKMESTDIILLIVGALLGIVVSFILFVLQFWASVARRRVERVAQATNEILANARRSGPLRNIHRYSLGVIIDDLRYFNGTPPWPCIIERNSNDRWDRYDKYIRPVVEEITPYAFLGRGLPSWAWPQTLQRVYALSLLCDQLETVTGLLDGAVEEKAIVIENRLITQVLNDLYDDKIEAEYRTLYDRWETWRRSAKSY